jgi:hypothetical protein
MGKKDSIGIYGEQLRRISAKLRYDLVAMMAWAGSGPRWFLICSGYFGFTLFRGDNEI